MKEGQNTHSECRELEPEDEDSLEGEIPGEVVENDAEREAFNEVEEPEDDPVGQPLDIILDARRLESLEGEVGGESPADEVAHWRSKRVDEKEQTEKDDSANGGVGFGNLSALLKGVHDWIFRELCASREDR